MNKVRLRKVKNALEEATLPKLPNNKSYRIGIIGAGFIVQNCHLVAYRKAGFNPVAIFSLDKEQCDEVADRFHLEKRYYDWKKLVDDESIEIIDF